MSNVAIKVVNSPHEDFLVAVCHIAEIRTFPLLPLEQPFMCFTNQVRRSTHTATGDSGQRFKSWLRAPEVHLELFFVSWV